MTQLMYVLGHASLCAEGVYGSCMGSHGYAPPVMCFTDEHFVMVYCKGNEKHLYIQCFSSDVILLPVRGDSLLPEQHG